MQESKKPSHLLKSIMGEKAYESLNKALVKLNTKSVVDLEELHSAIKTVPKALMAFLVKELKDMEKDQTKEISLPWAENATLNVTKMDADVYRGRVTEDSKIIHDFDLTAIPQLAAHLMSAYELYDIEDSQESEEKFGQSDELKQQIKALDEKIGDLISLLKDEFVKIPKKDFIDEHEKLIDTLKSPSKKDDKEEAKEQEKELEEVKKSMNSGFKKIVGKLKKAGMAPKMPSPPKAGTKVGGNQGITQAGFHGEKTEHSDLRTKPTVQMKNPYLKAPAKDKSDTPKQPKQPKLIQSEKPLSEEKELTMTIKKSELNGNCADCGQNVSDCACFKALSKPSIIKSSNGNVILKFSNDWDREAVGALYKSIISGHKK